MLQVKYSMNEMEESEKGMSESLNRLKDDNDRLKREKVESIDGK